MKLTGDQTAQPIAATPPSVSNLANTAHELRTPLTSVLATLELLQTGGLTANEATELLEGATIAALHLVHLIDDILDEAALAAGQLRLHRKTHRVCDLLDDLERVIHVQASDRGVRLEIAEPDPDLEVDTDERRFLQIALNLVGNALKFSPRGSAVGVEIKTAAASVRFLVLDEGPGIPEAALGRLFSPFASVDPDSMVRGTGLGLALCDQLVRRLGGRIGFEAREQRGSMFWFELPRAVAKAVAPAP